MKALKYGLTLVLGLTVLGFSARVQAQTAGQQNNEGVRIPAYIGNLVDQQAYGKAMVEFDKFIKTAPGDLCDILRLSFMFYNNLLQVDTAKADSYKGKVDSYRDQYLQSCNTAYAYLLKNEQMNPQNFDSTVVWMTRAIALDATDGNLYLTRGYALWQLQRTEEACADYKKAKDLDEEFYGSNYDTWCVTPEESAEVAAEPAPAE